MAILTPTFSDDDLRDGWTEGGSPSYVDDQHNPLSGVSIDGIDDYLTHTTATINDATNLVFACCCWIKPDDISAGGIIFEQSVSTTDHGWYLYMNTDGSLQLFIEEDTTTKRTLSNSSNTLSDGVWSHVFATIDVTGATPDINLYIDGVECSYTRQDEPDENGHFPSTGFGNSLTDLTFGARYWASASLFVNGTLSRPRLYDNVLASSTDVLDTYNDEFSKIGEGFGDGAPEFLLLHG